jgi:hypothetical protein
MMRPLSLVAAMSLSLSAAPALADGSAPEDPALTRAQVIEMLRSEGRVPEEALAALAKQLEENGDVEGYGNAVSAAARQAIADGCTGTCLADVVRGVNGSLDKGRSPDQAAEARGSRATAEMRRSEAQQRAADGMMRGHERMNERARDAGAMRGAGRR